MAKTIMITGAGSGLGKGTALGLANEGHKVIAAVENHLAEGSSAGCRCVFGNLQDGYYESERPGTHETL